MALDRPRQAHGRGQVGLKAEAAIVFLIADQDHRAVAELGGLLQALADERPADALAAQRRLDGHRAEQQGVRSVTDADVPEADGAEDVPPVLGDEGEPVGRQAAVPQSLRGLPVAPRPEGAVEQVLDAIGGVGCFVTDRDHRHGLQIQ